MLCLGAPIIRILLHTLLLSLSLALSPCTPSFFSGTFACLFPLSPCFLHHGISTPVVALLLRSYATPRSAADMRYTTMGNLGDLSPQGSIAVSILKWTQVERNIS